MKKKLYITPLYTILCLSLSSPLAAQPTLRMDSIVYVGVQRNILSYISHDNAQFIRHTGGLNWKRSAGANGTDSIFFNRYDSKPIDSASLYEDERELLEPDSIMDMSQADMMSALRNKQLILEADSTHKTVLFFANDFVLAQVSMQYNKAYKGGFGTYRIAPNEEEKKWRVNRAFFSARNNFVTVNGAKNILVYQNGYIIPTQKGWLIYAMGMRKRIVPYNMPTLNFSADDYVDMMEGLNAKTPYSIRFVGDGKCQLTITANELVLPQLFDSIQFMDKFIIGKIGSYYIVYNAQLKQLSTPKVRAFAYDNPNLQIVEYNQLRTIGYDGNEGQPYIFRTLICGTGMQSYSYEIKEEDGYFFITDGRIFQHQISKILRNGSTVPAVVNTKNRHGIKLVAGATDVRFLDGTKHISYNSEDGYDAFYRIQRNWLLVQKQQKFGIVSTDYWGYGDSNKTVLPVIYDSISVSKRFGEPVRIYRKGLVGYFPINKDARYAKLEERIKNFVRFTMPNGRQGWLNIKEAKEYLDEL